MSITDLLPWKRKKEAEIQREETLDPIQAFRRDMERWFDNVLSRDFGLLPLGSERSWYDFVPSVDVTESNKEITVTADLPGMEEADIELQLQGNTLVIRGKKEQRTEEKDEHTYRAERSYGAFQRSIALPAEVNASKASAHYRKGVLTVKLPKAKPSRRKAITVSRG